MAVTAPWVPRFACPECRQPIAFTAAASWWCAPCDERYERRGGVYRFLTARRGRALQAFDAQYRHVRAGEGRSSLDAAHLQSLPHVGAGRPEATHWRVRGESYAHLFQMLAARPGPLRVLDIGAGNGWLSHRLASHNHFAVALDRLDDEGDGLGAWRHYPTRFTAVQADFDALPFEPGQFDAAIFNGSLHYAASPAATLAEARRVLAPGGALAVMDSPMFAAPADGEAMLGDQAARLRAEHGLAEVLQPGRGFLTFAALDQAAAQLEMRSRFVPTRGPITWRVGRLMARTRIGRAPASFGVWVAQ